MNPRFTCLCVVEIASVCNCGCLRFAADTVLTVSYPEDTGHPEQVMGIWEFYHDDGLLWGLGWWHPREHETYVLPFMISEPFYASTPRVLSLKRSEVNEGSPDRCEIALALDSDFTPYGDAPSDRAAPVHGNDESLQLFRSELPIAITEFLGKHSCSLNDVTLERIGNPSEIIHVSGRVVATPMPEDVREWLEENDVLVNGD